MLDSIIRFSLRNRLLVCLVSLVVVAFGVTAVSRLPIDAFPDTTPVQVQINTVAPSLNPLEIEQQITHFVELSIGGPKGSRPPFALSIGPSGLSGPEPGR